MEVTCASAFEFSLGGRPLNEIIQNQSMLNDANEIHLFATDASLFNEIEASLWVLKNMNQPLESFRVDQSPIFEVVAEKNGFERTQLMCVSWKNRSLSSIQSSKRTNTLLN